MNPKAGDDTSTSPILLTDEIQSQAEDVLPVTTGQVPPTRNANENQVSGSQTHSAHGGPPLAPDATIRCPFCSEHILASAKKCKHCGEFLDKRNTINATVAAPLQNRKAYVPRALSQAWAGETAELARRRLKTLIQWLERNGESGAAASLREGLEKTLTVLKLGLPPALRTFLVTTNAIENLMGSARRISRNVTRWRAGEMISRWTAAGPLHAKQGFHRIKGYRHLPLLARALRAQASQLDATVEAA